MRQPTPHVRPPFGRLPALLHPLRYFPCLPRPRPSPTLRAKRTSGRSRTRRANLSALVTLAGGACSSAWKGWALRASGTPNEEERMGTTCGDECGVADHCEGIEMDDRGGRYYCFWGARKRGSGPMLRRWRSTVVTRRERVVGRGSCFPPLISIVNRPWVSLRGYRCDGRFMLKEVTVPEREFLHASREGGRLRLDFVQGLQDDDEDEAEEDDEAIEEGNEEEGDVEKQL